MAHPVGEKLRCDDCGAEILYLAACNCAEEEKKTHSLACCGQEMRSLGVISETEKQAAVANLPKKSAA